MNPLIRNMAFQLTRKRVAEANLSVLEIEKKQEELSVFGLSTNAIISFEYEGKIWYFRECPRILSKEAYWNKANKRFFDSLGRLGVSKNHFTQEIPIRTSFTNAEIEAFRAYLEDQIKDRVFRKTLENADRIARKVQFSIWEKQTYETGFFAAFGFAGLPEHCRDLAVYYLWSMRTVADQYRLMHVIRSKQYSLFAATKSVASRIVAEELGLAYLITPAIWCRLITEGTDTMFGVLSPAAPGRRMLDSAVDAVGSLQRELINLNVLDAVCFQPDHGPNNYNLYGDEIGQITICAFDNDNPKTFFPVFSVCHSLAGCDTLVDSANRIQRPYMDKDLAMRLRNLDKEKLRQRLNPYLNRLQIAAVCYRIEKINRAIINTEKKQPDFLKDTECWNLRTVEEEISGKYGETYLKKVSAKDAASTS